MRSRPHVPENGAIAVEYCEAKGLPYVITAHPGQGYNLRLLKDDAS